MSENSNDMTTPQEPIPAQVGAPITPATPMPAAPVAKSSGVRTYVLAGASAVVGAVLVLGAGVIGYSIGNHDGENHRSATLTVSGERGGQQGGAQGGTQGDGPMMGGNGQRGVDPDGDNWTGGQGATRGGQQGGPMMGGDTGSGPAMGGDGQRGVDPNGDNWTGGQGATRGGQQGGPMMQGNGIQDFLNQLQSGQGLTGDQQQFLDQLKGFVGGMRNQVG